MHTLIGQDALKLRRIVELESRCEEIIQTIAHRSKEMTNIKRFGGKNRSSNKYHVRAQKTKIEEMEERLYGKHTERNFLEKIKKKEFTLRKSTRNPKQ